MQSMQSPIRRLSIDNFCIVVSFSEHRDILTLTRTCKVFHIHASPYLYKTVILKLDTNIQEKNYQKNSALSLPVGTSSLFPLLKPIPIPRLEDMQHSFLLGVLRNPLLGASVRKFARTLLPDRSPESIADLEPWASEAIAYEPQTWEVFKSLSNVQELDLDFFTNRAEGMFTECPLPPKLFPTVTRLFLSRLSCAEIVTCIVSSMDGSKLECFWLGSPRDAGNLINACRPKTMGLPSASSGNDSELLDHACTWRQAKYLNESNVETSVDWLWRCIQKREAERAEFDQACVDAMSVDAEPGALQKLYALKRKRRAEASRDEIANGGTSAAGASQQKSSGERGGEKSGLGTRWWAARRQKWER